MSLDRDSIMDCTYKCDRCENWMALDVFSGFVDSLGVVLADFIWKYNIPDQGSPYICSSCLAKGRTLVEFNHPKETTLTIVSGDGRPLETKPSLAGQPTTLPKRPVVPSPGASKATGTPPSQPSTTTSASAYGQNNQSPVHNLDWAYGVENGKGILFALQSPPDHFHYSQILAALLAGQFYLFHFYLPKNPLPGQFANVLEICVDDRNSWVLSFNKDKRLISKSVKLNGEYLPDQSPEPLIFHPDGWNRVKIIYKNGEVRCEINGVDFGNGFGVSPQFVCQLKVRVVGLYATFGGVSV